MRQSNAMYVGCEQPATQRVVDQGMYVERDSAYLLALGISYTADKHSLQQAGLPMPKVGKSWVLEQGISYVCDEHYRMFTAPLPSQDIRLSRLKDVEVQE